MTLSTTEPVRLRVAILERIDEIVCECESQSRPLEMEPWKGRLFELFAAAEEAGCISEDSPVDLTADGVCQALADRWGLKSAAENWIQRSGQLPPGQMSRMRSLWSVLRMWMEWTYAWERWSEFHANRRGMRAEPSENR